MLDTAEWHRQVRIISIIGDTVNFGMNTREVRGEYSVVVGTNPQWKQEHIRTGWSLP